MKHIEPKQETIIAAMLATTSNDQTAYSLAADAAKLCQIGRAMNRVCEAECNYGQTDRTERRVTRLRERAQEIAARYGLAIYTQRDPRGACLRIGETKHTAESGYTCL